MKKDLLRKAVQLLTDLVKAAALGLVIALLLGVVFALGGLLFGGVDSILETVKNGLLLVFSVVLLIVAGMLLIRGKKPEKIRLDEKWRKHFHVIGTKTMLLAVAVGMMILITIIDAVQMSLH